ncbi:MULTISPECIES: hypothetical protein [Dyella]|uniref:DUF1795 domain-containing protein n=2 Tax=Dyella TaxID=231454 RepID=A0A4V2NMA3_9GAMM|nr:MULTISPECIES: hypothetical protein [Dyella]TBR39902.1 hypothetical protein EYV96_06880 [Dyella terrae]TCI12517.1 hypothetical protein EZM97_03990 [Dyella soli]
MSFLRTTFAVSALLLAGAATATDIDMAGGSVRFHTPDPWVGIMETQGDPEVRVFQVPDSSPTGTTALARVTVTVKQVADVGEFQQYMNLATNKAKALTGYQAGGNIGPNNFAYSAQENGTQFAYIERYWFKEGRAIQLRCVRPAQSQSGAAWKAAFDKGCDDIAAQLK